MGIFGNFLAFYDGKNTLNKQWFDVGSSPTDSGGFLLPGVLVVLGRKTRPEVEMLRGWNTDISTLITEMMPIAARIGYPEPS